VKQVQRWPWERIERGKQLLRCVCSAALRRPRGERRGHIVLPRAPPVIYNNGPYRAVLIIWPSHWPVRAVKDSFALALDGIHDRGLCLIGRVWTVKNNWGDLKPTSELYNGKLRYLSFFQTTNHWSLLEHCPCSLTFEFSAGCTMCIGLMGVGIDFSLGNTGQLLGVEPKTMGSNPQQPW